MSYATIPDFSAGELTSAELNVVVDAINALFPVGFYAYICRAATTTATLVNGVWLECNGVSVLRADYPDLNTLFASMSYPFLTADGTHMYLPDAQGRTPVSMASGGHADVNALGAADSAAKANRSPKHSHTTGLSAPAHSHTLGAASISPNPHTHSFTADLHSGGLNVSGGSDSPNNSAAGTTGSQSLSIAGSTDSGGSGSVTGTVGLSGRLADTPAYLVAGCLFIKAKA